MLSELMRLFGTAFLVGALYAAAELSLKPAIFIWGSWSIG